MKEVRYRNVGPGQEEAPLSASSHRTALPVPQPRKKRYWKTISAAVGLFTLGTIMIIVGSQVLYSGDRERGIYMMALGSIMFIPGSYASYILYGAWRGWQGYHYDQIPSYDD